jgi:hypothetical protein
MTDKHTLERWAPVQGEIRTKRPPGMISWEEHVKAWKAYNEMWNSYQSAERIAERGGFGYEEIVMLLGREPETWEPRKQEDTGP